MDYLQQLARIARSAGDAILEVYDGDDFGLTIKEDDSPLTRADLAAHHLILSALGEMAPDLPVLSEESDPIAFEERTTWKRYFLVDPLDGTKEFIRRNGEFTVNIALIEGGVPTQGVVFAPAKDVLYGGNKANGIAFVERRGHRKNIATRPVTDPLLVVTSRRHDGKSTKNFLAMLKKHFKSVETTSMGSSLKSCLVAQGVADLYPRLGTTSEWDTAASQAVVEAAGGRVVDGALRDLRYNTKAETLNPFFYVIGDPGFDWGHLLMSVDMDS